MSHPLVEVLDKLQDEFEDDLEHALEACRKGRSSSEITLLTDRREARKVAAFEARDLAIATAVRDAILERNRLGWEKFPALNLIKIIEGVK